MGSTVDNGGSKKMRSATDSSTLTRMIRESATFHPYAQGGPNGMYLPKKGRWASYDDATPWMNGVRYGNLFLGAYESSPRNTVREAYTSDIPEPPKVVLERPIYPVFFLGPIFSSNPATLTIASGGTIWTYTIATNSVKSIAGSGTNLAHATNIDGQGMNARFADIFSLEGTSDGTLYVLSRVWHIVRRISPTGYVERFFGTGAVQFFVPGSTFETGTLRYPGTLYLDRRTGSLYIGNPSEFVIVTSSRTVSVRSLHSSVHRAAIGQFAVDSEQNIIAPDSTRHVIIKITPSGTVSIIAGGDQVSGYTDSSTATDARFNEPLGLVVDSQNNIIVYESGNRRFRKITPAGVVTTLAGNGTEGETDGTGAAATFNIPLAHYLQLQIDPADNVWIPFGRIRKMTPAGVVTTVYRHN